MRSVKARAKINLYLAIRGRRPDGYHWVDTVYQSLELCDDVTVLPRRSGVVVTADDPAAPKGPDNLAFRASAVLGRMLFGPDWEPCEGRPGAAVHIVKRIPMQAGLGGGSADASATLLGLWEMWTGEPAPRPVSPSHPLWSIAAGLGADVPFGLLGGCAIGHGRGELLTPLPGLAGTPVVLAFPPFGLSTAAVYQWWDEDHPGVPALADTPAPADLTGVVAALRSSKGLFATRNDLEPVVFARYPALEALKTAMLANGAWAAAMSGSGSTVFALARNDRVAAEIARDVTRVVPGTKVIITRAWGEA